MDKITLQLTVNGEGKVFTLDQLKELIKDKPKPRKQNKSKEGDK